MTRTPEIIRCFYCEHKFTFNERAVAVDKKGKPEKIQYDYIRCPRCLSARNSAYYASKKKLEAGKIKLISPLAETPFSGSEGVSAGGNESPDDTIMFLVDNRHHFSGKKKGGK